MYATTKLHDNFQFPHKPVKISASENQVAL